MDVKQLIQNFQNVVTKHYMDFNGRVARTQFWQYILVYVVIAVVFAILRLQILSNVLALALFLPSLGIAIRRLHDIDKSGWLVLLPMIPGVLMGLTLFIFYPLAMVLGLAAFACGIYLIYLYAQPGTVGANQYGPDPSTVAA